MGAFQEGFQMGTSAYNAARDRQQRQQELDMRQQQVTSQLQTEAMQRENLGIDINDKKQKNQLEASAISAAAQARGIAIPQSVMPAPSSDDSGSPGMAAPSATPGVPSQGGASAKRGIAPASTPTPVPNPTPAADGSAPTAGMAPSSDDAATAAVAAAAKQQAIRTSMFAEYADAKHKGDTTGALNALGKLDKYDYTDALNKGIAQRMQAAQDNPDAVKAWAQHLTNNSMPITHDGVDPKTGIHTLTLTDEKGKPYTFSVSPEQAARADAAYELAHSDPRFADFGQADIEGVDTKLGAMIAAHNATTAQVVGSSQGAYTAQSGRIGAMAQQSQAAAANLSAQAAMKHADAYADYITQDRAKMTNPQTYVTMDANGNPKTVTGGMQYMTHGPDAGTYKFATTDTPSNMVPLPQLNQAIEKIEPTLTGKIPPSVAGSLGLTGANQTWEQNPDLRHATATKMAMQGLTLGGAGGQFGGLVSQMRNNPLPGSGDTSPSAPAAGANPVALGLQVDPTTASPNYPGGQIRLGMPNMGQAQPFQLNPQANWPGGQPQFMPGIFGRQQ